MIDMRIVAKLKGHEPMITTYGTRKEMYVWVVEHADQIESLEVVGGTFANTWHWSPDVGWVQIPTGKYFEHDPGFKLRKPQRHGNAYWARHPWRYCMDSPLTPNPLCAMRSLFD